MKRSVIFIAVTVVCVLLAITALMSFAQDNKAKPARPAFIPSPIFSPPYPALPHHFRDVRTIQLLCQAPKGALKRAVMPPMEATGDADTFVLLLGWTADVEDAGFNVHEIAINAPVKWSDKTGNTTVIEYIDSDMGLIAGREIYGWPKKMADITWSKTNTGWTVIANKMKDQGSRPLMMIDYTISQSTPEIPWPNMGPTLLVRRIPNASATTLVAPAGPKYSKGTATVRFFDTPHDPQTFLGPIKVLGAKMTVLEGRMPGGLIHIIEPV